MPAELPAARVPAADATRARAHPDEPRRVLIQRHHERISQRRTVVRVVPIVTELTREPVEQRETVGRAHPEAARPVLEQRSHVIAGERRRVARVVTERLEHAAVAVQAEETVVRTFRSTARRSDPRGRARPRCRAASAYARAAGRRASCVRASACQRLSPRSVPIQTSPARSSVSAETRSLASEAGIVGIVTQVLDVSRGRIEHVDAGVDTCRSTRYRERRRAPCARGRSRWRPGRSRRGDSS